MCFSIDYRSQNIGTFATFCCAILKKNYRELSVKTGPTKKTFYGKFYHFTMKKEIYR